ncbi:MAG: tryptophan--tRNA ligase, partial [Patescibacteria group bacterium]
MKPILISGIQPSGKLHIGNYLGALKNFVDLQNTDRYQCYFFIADLHALTENPEAKNLSVNIINLATDFLAAGLDPEKSIIFQQSQIQPLQELKWILSTLTPISELMRMTAFKEKVLQPLKSSERKKITKENLNEIIGKSNFGLAEYPILMAADILIYNAQLVPVGDDQLQHLEFARTL